jgi:hypothetical protein
VVEWHGVEFRRMEAALIHFPSVYLHVRQEESQRLFLRALRGRDMI